MIIIVTEPTDPHADRVCEILDEQDARYLRFDNACFPAHARYVGELTATGNHTATLLGLGSPVDLSEARAIWWRRPSRPEPAAEVTDPFVSTYISEESEAFLKDVWQSLDCAWIPAPELRLRAAERKLSQLHVATKIGFAIPRTLVANDPEAFLRFYRKHGPKVISKLPSGTLFRASARCGNDIFRFTEPVTRSDLGYVDSIRYCPVIFQEQVEKCLEFRVTVVGEKVFAVAIHSQESRRTQVDWRHYDPHHTTHEVYRLPSEVERKCLSMLRFYGLAFAAIDMILTPDGEFVFLEMNPNGQYLWLEDLVRIPISRAVAELLISYDRNKV